MFDNLPDETYSPEDAQTVFNAVLARPDLLPLLREALCPQDFNPQGERPMWLALDALVRQGQPLTPEALARQLVRSGDFSSAIAALPHLALFDPLPPGDAVLAGAVENLRRRSRERRVVALLADLVELGLAHPADPAQAILAIRARVDAEEGSLPGRKSPPPLSARALVADAAAAARPAWLVERLLPAGGVSLLAGEVASGKTFLALDLAIAVAAGSAVAWGGRACLAGPVLYCCLDSSPRTMRARVQALCAGRAILPPEDLFFDFSPLDLAHADGQARLRSLVHAPGGAGPAALVVLDVLARYLPGLDENSVAAVGPVFTLLRNLAAQAGVSFLVVHHFNKSAAPLAGVAGRMQRVRGSSDIAAAVDAVLSVTLRTPVPAPGLAGSAARRPPRRTITPEKNRDLPEEPPFDFSIETAEGGLARLVFSDPFTPPETSRDLLARACDLVRDLLRAAPGPLSRAEIERRLHALPQGDPRFSVYVLNRLFIELAASPEILVGRAGRVKTYALSPPL